MYRMRRLRTDDLPLGEDILPSGSDEKRTYTVKEYDALLRRVAKLENMVAILQTDGCTVHAPLKES